MAIIDVVKWNASPEELVWKFPSDELSTATRLIVSTAQEAFVVLGGEVSDAYGPGTHILDTGNVPLLRKLVNIPFGGQTPYSAEVWFVQKTMPLNLLWGTQDPIQILDPEYKVPVPVRCYGQFGIQIQNAGLFLKTLVGTYTEFDTARLCDYFKAMVQTKVKTLIAGCFKSSGCSIFEINSHLDSLSAMLSNELAIGFADFGVGLINFYVQSVNFPQDDPAIAAIRESLTKRADMTIRGYNYTQERSFDVLQGAAENEGSSAAFAGAGIGLGLGAAVGGAIAPAVNQSTAGILNVSSPVARKCVNCGVELQAESRFCHICGSGQVVHCCGKPVPEGARFCPQCGKMLNK